jgi:hypothetical protein
MQLMSCLAKNDTSELIVFESDLTVSKAMDGIQLNKLSTQIEKKNVIKAIAYLALRLSENFNVGKKFTPTQASMMALDLFEVFGFETLEDVVLMFKYARQGRIGDGKDFRLDSQTVFHKWIPAYLELKAQERENQHQKVKDDFKGITLNGIDRKVASKMFEGIGDEKVNHNRSGSGLGSRHKKRLQKKGIVTNRTDYLEKVRIEAQNVSEDKLKEYLSLNGENSQNYDAQVYEIVEHEIHNRYAGPGGHCGL